MQPYFLPYIGYFQLIAAVDEFVIYDNIKYTKKGWINRNRYLLNGGDSTFTLPLQKAADDLNVVERELAESFNREKLLNQLRGAYGKAPYYDDVLPLIERVISYSENNLFRYVHHSVSQVCAYIGIETPITVSSTFSIDHTLKSQAKVMALCKARSADAYINPIGGTDLYASDDFAVEGIELKFHKSAPFEYPQFRGEFVPWLSIVDVLMFNPLDKVRTCINENYELI